MAKRNRALDKWLRAQRPPYHTQTALARLLGVQVSTVNELLRGKKPPSLALALKIEKKIGIPPRAFREVA